MTVDTSTPAPVIQRENLTRLAPFTVRTDEGDGLTLDGYGAIFNRETVIDSWEGTFRETIAPGAFRKSLSERTPRMQFDHGRHPLIGSIPIGTFSAGYPQEDAQGLHCVGRLTDNWLIQPVRDAIADGGVDGMSFRFSVVREEWTDASGRKLTDPRTIAEFLWRPPDDGMLLRTLRELKVSEVGPVVWPAYEETSVGVRGAHQLSGVIDLSRLDDPATRTMLARAVYAVDARDAAHRGPQTPGAQRAGGTTQHDPARPPSSATTPADHPAADTRTAPDGGSTAPGEHQTPTPRPIGRPRADIARWLTSRSSAIEKIRKA